MRINDIVKTAIALSTLDSIRANPVASTSDRQGKLSQVDDGTQAADQGWDRGSDAISLSSDATTQQDDPYADSGEDAPFGALVESFVRQRSIMQIALPIQTASGQGVFSLTVDVERAYRVIEYIPGLNADVQA